MKQITDREGSTILAALMLGLIVASIAGLYLRSVTQEIRYTYHTRLMLSAVNVAEAGVEDALYAIQYNDWTGWNSGAYGYSYSRTLYTGNRGEVRRVNTFIDTTDVSAPKILSEAIMTHDIGIEIRKQIRIDLDRSGVFSNGLTSRNGVTMNGNNVAVDSYNSGNGAYHAGLNRNDNGSVASTSVSVGAVSIQNADIWGWVATGGGMPQVGSKGSVLGADSPSEAKIDPNRISTDFYAEFPAVSAPTLSSPSTSLATWTMGTPHISSEWKLSSLSVGSGKTLKVSGDVILVIDGDIDVKGEIFVETGSSLTVYVKGDVDIGGNGIVNDKNPPADVVLFSTAKEGDGKQIKLHGNGALSAAVYAPFADVELKGGGSSGVMYGAVVGNEITLTGNYEFHYDEALSDYGTNGSYRLESWRELNDASAKVANVLSLKDSGMP